MVGDGIDMLDPMKNRAIGPSEVVEKFGVGPEKVVDVQALAGDSVDNVPGVPGVGVKTAAQLIHEYGDLDTLLERAGEIKQNKRRENLIEFADQARISRDPPACATMLTCRSRWTHLRSRILIRTPSFRSYASKASSG